MLCYRGGEGRNEGGQIVEDGFCYIMLLSTNLMFAAIYIQI